MNVPLEPLAAAFELDPSSFSLIRDGMNRVYSARSLGGEDRIVRLTADSHRPLEELQSELHWMHHLATRDCDVAAPYLSGAGQLVETVGDWHCSVLRRAVGRLVEPGGSDWNEEIFELVGRTVGHMHQANVDYTPGPTRRYAWHSMPELERLETLSDVPLAEAIKRLRDRLRARGDCPELVHNDVKTDNFFLHDGRLTLFDFDISCYCWPVQDLVVPLYFYFYYPWCRVDGDPVAFMQALLSGYRSQRALGDDQLQLVDDLLLWRSAFIYLILDADRPHWIEAVKASKRMIRCDLNVALDEMREQLLRDRALSEVDWSSL